MALQLRVCYSKKDFIIFIAGDEWLFLKKTIHHRHAVTMKQLKTLLFVVLSLPFFSLAQNYQPGTVVNSKGDTLHGFISYSEGADNPKRISFKSDPSGAVVRLKVNDVKYFNVSVGYLAEYQRYEGPVSTDFTEINHLYIGRDTGFRIDTVFLKIVQRGKNLTLFSFTDDIKERFFIAKNPGDTPVELVYRIYYNSNEENGRDRTVYENTFKKQLYQIANDSNTITTFLNNYINESEYRERNIVYIVSKINGYSETDASKSNLSKPRAINKVLAIVGILVIVGAVIDGFIALNSH